MKRTTNYVICCIASLVLVGCQQESGLETQNNTVQESDEGQEFSDTLSYVDSYTTVLPSGIKVEAAVDMPELSEKHTADIYKADYQTIDGKKLAELLMSETEITCREQEQPGENGGTGMLRTYTGADGSEMISSDDIWIHFSSDKFYNIRTDWEAEDENEISVKAFAFASTEEADDEIRQLLDKVGISLYAEYSCVSMNYEMLKEKNLKQYDGWEDIAKCQEEISALEGIPWSDAYDCYCFTYYAEINGWRMGCENREMNNAFVPGTVVRVAYTKDGIQCMEISNIYQEKDIIETGELITIEEMLKVIDEKYASIIMQGDYTITDIALEYVADIADKGNSYQLVPVWKCEMLHEYSTQGKTTDELIEMEQQSYILINAIKGTELYQGGSI